MAVQGNLFDDLPFGGERSPAAPAAPPAAPRPGRVLVAHGARAAEEVLLAEVEALAAAAAAEPRLLARPVRIVVPSRSLRRHLAERLVARRGRSLAGVLVQTLHGLALEVLERAGEATAGAAAGDALLPVVVERLAEREPALRRGLDALEDGYAAAAATVRDLLDAGLEPAHEEAVLEALSTDGPRAGSAAQVDRARALVRVAAATAEAMERLGVRRRSDLERLAAEALGRDPDLLPARAVLVYGYADVTGVAGDLLDAVLRAPAARLVVDLPPEPGAGFASTARPPKGPSGAIAGTAGVAGAVAAPGKPMAADVAGVAGAGDVAGPAGSAAAAGRPAVEGAFARRLLERFGGGAEVPGDDGGAPPPPAIHRRAAPGADAEARAAAAGLRVLLDGGARPERIAVVARDLSAYRLPLRRHLTRLGVPFSGVGEEGAATPEARRARALLDLLRRGESTPTDRWLEAAVRLGGAGGRLPWLLTGARRADLRLALFSLGAGRLCDVAALDLDRVLRGEDAYALPVRQGLAAARAEDSDEEGEREPPAAWATRRRVPGELLRAAVRAAGALAARLGSWPREAAVADHTARLLALVAEDLGWRAGDAGGEDAAAAGASALAAIESLVADLPPGLRIKREELITVLRHPLAEAGRGPVGGTGGGVQVLSATEARARTFDHLVLLGLNRDRFPRPVREDPLLPDDLRAVLRRVLPDLPEKRTGFDEERYLFAQLLSASPEVALSWQESDDDGNPVSPSPLLERLPLAPGETIERVAPPPAAPLVLRDPVKPAAPFLLTAAELATVAALHAPRRVFGSVLPLAIAEGRRTHGAGFFDLSPERLAAARLAVLDELDPDRRTVEGRRVAASLGPYFGFIGPLAGTGVETVRPEAMAPDPRHRPLFVTLLERLAGCPWQVLAGRLLAIEPAPDPLAALPVLDKLLLGSVVHRVLERIAREAGVDETPGSAPSSPASPGVWGPAVEVPWPEPERLDSLLAEEAEAVLAEEGVLFQGLARALAAQARPFLDRARVLDWGRGPVPVVGAESEGGVLVPDARGRPRPVRFKADRIDRDPATGALRLTDYKTGKPLSDAKREDVRRRHLLRDVREGRRLQAVAYLLAGGEGAAGRYLFLDPAAETAEFAATAADGDLLAAFAASAGAALAAWDAGSFFPRVVDPKGHAEPLRCTWCDVAEACLRGDSGARRRLFEWAEGRRAAEAATGGAHEPPGAREAGLAELTGVWRLPLREETPRGTPGAPGPAEGEAGEDGA